jgi:hypothetical protein
MHRFLLRRISVKYGRIFALNSALQESRLATLSIQIFLRRSTRLTGNGENGIFLV